VVRTKGVGIFSTLFGNKNPVARLTEALAKVPELDTTYIFLDIDDYKKISAPRWARATNAWHVEFLARQKARGLLDTKFDILLVSSWEFVVAFRDVARRVPAAAMFDAVPATMNAQIRQRGTRDWKGILSHHVHDRSFANAVQNFDLFLPKGVECADALRKYYGISSEQCRITLSPQQTHFWTPSQRQYSAPTRLLFVGNDFTRKGGEFLLRLYTNHLAESCTLTIVSNDPDLSDRQLPPGVTWLRGKIRDQLLEIYRSNDIFLFPTLQDFVPEAVAEALTVGLPCLVNDIDGLRDLVINGQSGFLFPRGAPTEMWANRIHSLSDDPKELVRMSRCARHFAEEMLSLERFESLVTETVDRLRSDTRKGNHLERR
jgi:glycosyltransferase involved in cell wall biosynthesis